MINQADSIPDCFLQWSPKTIGWQTFLKKWLWNLPKCIQEIIYRPAVCVCCSHLASGCRMYHNWTVVSLKIDDNDHPFFKNLPSLYQTEVRDQGSPDLYEYIYQGILRGTPCLNQPFHKWQPNALFKSFTTHCEWWWKGFWRLSLQLDWDKRDFLFCVGMCQCVCNWWELKENQALRWIEMQYFTLFTSNIPYRSKVRACSHLHFLVLYLWTWQNSPNQIEAPI